MATPPLISVRLLSIFLAYEKVKVLNHRSYSPDLSPCDFFLFPRLKKCFLEISIRLKVLRYQKKIIYLLFSTGKKVTKMCFIKGVLL